MIKKPARRIKAFRNSEPIDKTSPQIRSDQRERLMALGSAEVRRVKNRAPIKLNSKKPKEIYTAGKHIFCDGCRRHSPTRRMYRYESSSRGSVTLCEICDEKAEVRSFYKLDALDRNRKRIKID
jgi:hypothetical protein